MPRKMLVTGGAGFIGSNACSYFANHGWHITALDNLSRRGSEKNLEWLKANHNINFTDTDIRDAKAVETVIRDYRPHVVLHLAAQVAVTTSVMDPRTDFEINAAGTFNLLDAIRVQSPESFFVNVSTNKLYGEMHDVSIKETEGRYVYEDLEYGVSESRRLDYYSPYGCSKGIADQYTIDFSRIYGLSTVTLRQSCIYGPRQMGVEDQGWVAWFIIAAMMNKKITIFGDGKQVRDVLHVDDLVKCYSRVIEKQGTISGDAFNIGGGPMNTLSLLELVKILEGSSKFGKNLMLEWTDWRPGDQKIFISDIRHVDKVLNWSPAIAPQEGIENLLRWVQKNRSMFNDI